MIEHSINGWPVSDDQNTINVRSFKIPGSIRSVRLNADAAPVLLFVANRFHKLVANLDKPPLAVWGYMYRKARVSPVWSDHASGTAIDLRSDKFPIGSRNMSVKQRLAVRAILRSCNGLVIWGGDYKNDAQADEMHFAIAPHVTKTDIKAWQISRTIHDNGTKRT